HRTHLAVMSAAEVDCGSGTCQYDFTIAQNAAYTQGSDPLADLSGTGAGPFALIGADGDGDGLIGAGDQTLWLSGRGALLGYHDWDLDLDGLTGSSDQTLWLSNRGQGSQVPATGAVAPPAARQAPMPLLTPTSRRLSDKSSH
ncbi:MAG TPA: hypothetical protein VKP65_04865, partial [Rhodothermales bacterium]|nr:hypothetical protein [Rhodothermales bacterium]